VRNSQNGDWNRPLKVVFLFDKWFPQILNERVAYEDHSPAQSVLWCVVVFAHQSYDVTFASRSFRFLVFSEEVFVLHTKTIEPCLEVSVSLSGHAPNVDSWDFRQVVFVELQPDSSWQSFIDSAKQFSPKFAFIQVTDKMSALFDKPIVSATGTVVRALATA
jgi:hypothetical protein